MYRYRIYGIILESEFEMKLLQPAEGSDSAQDVITVSERDVEDEVVNILKEAQALEARYLIGTGISAFVNKGGFYLIRHGREILFKTKEGYDADGVSAWLLGFALSMALLQKRIQTIHCSAVINGGGAVLIAGIPGAGKSSLARKLIESGYRIMADDVAAVRLEGDECLVYPAFPYQKLCSNEVAARGLDPDEIEYIEGDKDKYLVPVKEIFEDKPHKLAFFFILANTGTERLSIRELSGFACFRAIKDNLFLHRLAGPWEADPEIISTCMKIASKCRIYLIERPEGVDTLDEITSAVKDLVEKT